MAKVTAGRDELGDFAPKFAELNDDVLFGEVWAREEQLSARDRSIVTVSYCGTMSKDFAKHLSKHFSKSNP